jgi:lipopolysaccharide/colanic/teichoic acid biosynthesis glycosyltransferase
MKVPRWSERSLLYRLTKRLLDLAVATPLLLLTVPIQVLIGLVIRLDSPGPALHRQKRLALDGKEFVFLKFRTMFADAPQRFPVLYEYGAIVKREGQAPFKLCQDPRVTTTGRWLRRTSLDELPNLVHVVRGEMSLVGPRPEILGLLPCYSKDQLDIFRVKPGVTGLPQVSGRNRLTVAETLELDYRYVCNASLRLDLQILGRTAWKVIRRKDAL